MADVLHLEGEHLRGKSRVVVVVAVVVVVVVGGGAVV